MDDTEDRPDRPAREGRRFTRPWEEGPGEDDAEDGPSSAPEEDARGPEQDADNAGARPDDQPSEGEPSAEDPWTDPDLAGTELDAFTDGDYLHATTREYQGLAEEVSRAQTEEYERQAVAASLAGVGTGLIGFEDVTGKKGLSEEEVEREEQQRASDLTLRVASGLVLVGLFLGTLMLGSVWFSVFVGLVMILSLGEFYATVRTRGYTPPAIFGFLALIGVAVGSHRTGAFPIGGWVLAALIALAFFYSVAARRYPLENLGITVFGLAWVSLLGFAIVIGTSERAVGLILLVVVVTALFDIGSYFVGRAFGNRPLAPKVSPQKTVEGLIGGIVTAFAVSAILSTFPLFDPVDLKGSLVFALMVSVLAPLGDAAESVVKRALGVKDMGSILPGHGGMLDRIDALLFVVPASYFLFWGLGYL